MPQGCKIEVRKSNLHGKGVFALEKIGMGWFIGTITGTISKSFPLDDRHVFFNEDTRGREWSINPEAPFRFLNHAGENANVVYDGVHIYALNLIREGEELTLDYGEEWMPGNPIDG